MIYTIGTLVLVLLALQMHRTSGYNRFGKRRAPKPHKQDCTLSELRMVIDCSKQCGAFGTEIQERLVDFNFNF